MKHYLIFTLYLCLIYSCQPIIPVNEISATYDHSSAIPLSPATPSLESDSFNYVSFDLFKLAPSGHVQQIGPTLSPNAPGWNQMVAGQKANIWRAPTQIKDQWVSWIEGRGASIDFPITENDKSLEYLFIWINPVATHQVVSIFLDEVLLKNISLKKHGRYYKLKLPQALQPGEHRLRFWFRFTRNAQWGGRTAGAIGPIHFFPNGVQPSSSQKLYDHLLLNQRNWGALLAPHPTTWRFYLMLPKHSHFKTHVYVKSGDPIRFDLFLSTDDMGSQILWSKVVKAGEIIPVNIDLAKYAHQPVRLTLKTQLEVVNSSNTESQIAWLDPKITSLHPTPKRLPPMKSVIVWSIAGLRYDLLEYILNHSDQYPNISRVLNYSYILPSLWSHGVHETSIHQQFLHPQQAPTSLPQILNHHGISTSLWSTHAHSSSKIASLFEHAKISESQQQKASLTSLDLLSSLNQTLQQEKNKKHFIYILSRELKLPMYKYNGFTIPELVNYRGMTISSKDEKYQQYLKQSIVLDYLFAQLLSILHQSQYIKDTVVVLIGSVGQKFKESRGVEGIGMPEEVQTPVCIWYPNRREMTHVTHHGGSLGALAATLLESLMTTDPLPTYQWPYESLAPFILKNSPMPLHIDHAISNGIKISRLGDFFMYERPHNPPLLWHLRDARNAWKDLSQSHPITLRTLRDGISVSSLRDGL